MTVRELMKLIQQYDPEAVVSKVTDVPSEGVVTWEMESDGFVYELSVKAIRKVTHGT